MDHQPLHSGVKAEDSRRKKAEEELLEKIRTILPRTSLGGLDPALLSHVMKIMEQADSRWFFFFKSMLVRNYQQLLFAKDKIARQSQSQMKNLEREIVENKVHKTDQ